MNGKESHNNQKKIAVVNDFSGFGRCSIAVALPIISVMKIQCCPLPTAIFSDHTGFDSYFFDDYTSKMAPYMAEGKKLDLQVDGICTGVLGSVEQIELVEGFLREF
ncbi:MAG: phosphomethylpyrimidine kinase, partial [Clostridiales bacterium]|nr:phosphomethylpyrimidine kinase [Clostridiales bacterium]